MGYTQENQLQSSITLIWLQVLFSLLCVWSGCDRMQSECAVRPRIWEPFHTPNGSLGHPILDYFWADQWWQTCVSGNCIPVLLIISKNSWPATTYLYFHRSGEMTSVSESHQISQSHVKYKLCRCWDQDVEFLKFFHETRIFLVVWCRRSYHG